MTNAQNGDKVKINYIGKLDNGDVFDSTQGRDPFEFILGSGQVIPGFDKAVLGMEIGQKKTAELPPSDAYGLYKEELIFEIDKSQLPAGAEVNVDDMLQMSNENGDIIPVRIAKISDNSLFLDANHMLAGKKLIFELELVDIEK